MYKRSESGLILFEYPEKLRYNLLDTKYNQNGNFSKIINKISAMLSEVDKPKHFLFSGNVGRGKTFLSEKIMRLMRASGMQGEFTMESKMWQKYKELINSHVSDKDSAFHKILNIGKVNILCIDDIGANIESDKQVSLIRNTIADRDNAINRNECYLTILSTNLNFAQIERIYGVRTADRLVGGYTIVNFKGESMRRRNPKTIE